MGSKYEEIDLSRVKPVSIKERASKVGVQQFAKPAEKGRSLREFIDSLPDILAGQTFRRLAKAIARARANGKPVIAGIGAHVIKCGLSAVITDLVRKNIITAVAMNGAGAIHDAEIALFGHTSEDVRAGLEEGTFGMTRETADFMNRAALRACEERLGLGESVGKCLLDAQAPHADLSITAGGYSSDIPVTVHVALGTDVTHMHPSADGSAYGEATMRDFRILTARMKELGGGGVVLNLGSAVILPEVMLKAFSILRNLGCDLSGMVCANLDFVQQYRAMQQIVRRVEVLGGAGMNLTCHHEILIPLLAHAVLEEMR